MPDLESTPTHGLPTLELHRVIDAAVRLSLEHDPDALTMQDIAKKSGVPLEQFVERYRNTNDILIAALLPLLQLNNKLLSRHQISSGERCVDGIIDMYLTGWKQYPNELLLSTRIRRSTLMNGLMDEHQRFLSNMLGLLARASGENLLRVTDPSLALKVLSRTAIPLLEIYSSQPSFTVLFSDSIRALLLR